MKKIIILAVLLSAHAFGRPFPVSTPKYTAIKACQLVLQHHHEDEINSDTLKTSFVRSLEYSTHQCSSQLQSIFSERQKDKTRENGLEWIYQEWGWIVEIVEDNDLSHTCIYFLRDSGEIVLIEQTI